MAEVFLIARGLAVGIPARITLKHVQRSVCPQPEDAVWNSPQFSYRHRGGKNKRSAVFCDKCGKRLIEDQGHGEDLK